MFTRLYGRMLGLSFLLVSASVTAVLAQQSHKAVPAIERNTIDNTPQSISFNAGTKVKAADAQAIFQQYLGIDQANTKMVFKNTTNTKAGITVDRYTQYYKGVKVEYGSFVVTSKNGEVSYMTGNFYKPTAELSATPAISEAQALAAALKHMGAKTYMWQDAAAEAYIRQSTGDANATYLPKGELVWVEDYNGGKEDRTLHLAYSFDVYASQPLDRQQVFVDAKTGAILYSNATLKHTAATGHSLYSGVVPFVTAKVGTSYRLYDSTRGNGVHTMSLHHTTSISGATELTSTTNTWPSSSADTAALDAQWAGEKVYDFWNTQMGRLSWDNANGILKQYVHYSTSYDNAFWDGAEMNYGDGSGLAAGGFTALVSLDVTAHEIGHGVCQATANLVYSKESGALNEGFSDCWGATIENWANPHETDAVSKKPWWMGEEIGGGVPLRRLDSPKLFGLPDTYLGTNWYSVTSCSPTSANDECGVHTNMGIISKWYYLITIGAAGTNDLHNAYSVTGLGWTEAANILYHTELTLASSATYSVTRTTSISAATTLYGACSPEVQAVTNAWYAVGVGAAYSGSSSVAAISGASTVPMGSTITLSDATTGGVWSSANTSIATVSSTGVVTPVAPGVDSIKYTVTGSCGTSYAAKAITVTTTCVLPVVGAISGTASVCVGATTPLSDTTAAGVWSSSTTSVASISTAGVVTGVAAGTATITYSRTNSCGTATATRIVTVNASLVAAITGATSVAAGSTINLTDATAGGTWSATNTKASVSASGVVTGSTAGVDTIKYTISSTCGTATATSVVTVTAAVSADIYTYVSSTTGVPTFVNAHISPYTNLTALGTGTTGACGQGFSGIDGFTGTTFSTSGASVQVSLTAATGYTINVNGFTAGLRRSSTGPTKARLAYSIDGGTTWVNNGTDFAPLNGSCATSTSGTTVASWTTFSVTNPSILLRIYPYGASSATGALQVYGLHIIGSVNSLTGFAADATESVSSVLNTEELMAIYPNPNTGRFNITLPENNEGGNVSIFDLNGRLITNQAVNPTDRTLEIDLSKNPKGFYVVKAIVDGKVFTQKVQVN